MGFLIVTRSARLGTAEMAQIPDSQEIAEFLNTVRSGTTERYNYHEFYDAANRGPAYLASDGEIMRYFAAWRVAPERGALITAALALSPSARWSEQEFYALVESALGEKSDNVQPLG